MRLLITGGSSYLGHYLIPLALSKEHRVCYTYFSQKIQEKLAVKAPQLLRAERVDIRQERAVEALAKQVKPNVIIHLAGSDRSPEMEQTITAGAKAIRDAAEAVDARLIHMSTDVIFDGQSAPYDETSQPNPTHPYGQAKLVAEEIISSSPNHTIVRPSLIYGLTIVDRSTEWITKSLKAGQAVTLFTNQIRSPVWAVTLSEACLELAASTYQGIIHVAGAQAVNRSELGRKLLNWWQVAPLNNLNDAPCPPNAPWPLDTRLEISLAKSLLTTPLLGLNEVLAMHPRR